MFKMLLAHPLMCLIKQDRGMIGVTGTWSSSISPPQLNHLLTHSQRNNNKILTIYFGPRVENGGNIKKPPKSY